MTQRWMTPVGYMRTINGKVYVGAEDNEKKYSGPCAEVYREDDWIRVVADKYDNALMLNIETVPFLIKALQKIQRDSK